MIQEQIVDYISSQIKASVSRDAIKAALVGAGWAATDVEDTLRKVEGPAVSMAQPMPVSRPASVVQRVQPMQVTQPAKTVGASSPSGNSFFSGTSSPASRTVDPQTIRVSDLVSTPVSMGSSSASARDVTKNSPTSFSATASGRTPSTKKGNGFMVTLILSILIILFAGLSGYLYLKNTTLASQVASVNSATQGTAGQASSLQSQVQALDASDTALASQVATLMDNNQALVSNLSFLAVPPGAASSTLAPTEVTVGGLISFGGPAFVMTTPYGVKVYVKNSSDPNVSAALKPLVGTATNTQLTGTYIPGSAVLTVTAVNGVPVNTSATVPAAAPTSTSGVQ